MQRPEVRIIDAGSTQNNETNVDGYEASALLAKYGFKSNYSTTTSPRYDGASTTHQDSRTFEDMVRNQEEEARRIMQRQQEQRMIPRAISFDDSRVGYSESKWSSVDVDGIQAGIQVTIVSDMKF